MTDVAISIQATVKEVFRRRDVFDTDRFAARLSRAVARELAEGRTAPVALRRALASTKTTVFQTNRAISRQDLEAELANVVGEREAPKDQDRIDLLLLTATEVETKAVLDVAKRVHQVVPTKRFAEHGVIYDLGVLGEARVVLIRTQMGSTTPGGSLATAIAASTALRPAHVVMVGICFGLKPSDQSIGDILLSQRVAMYEPQRLGTSTDGDLQPRDRGDIMTCSTFLLSLFQTAGLEWQPERVESGLFVSGEKLVDNLSVRNDLATRYQDGIGGEMEGAGVYAGLHGSGTQWILVKAVCDFADGQKNRDKSMNQARAANGAAAFVLSAVADGGFGPRRP